MRTIEWRRYQEDLIVKKRLKSISFNWWNFKTKNGDKISNPKWHQHLGLSDHHFFKKNATRVRDTRYKTKYSPNKTIGYSRDPRKSRESLGTREKDKREFLKLLKEYGYK